MTRHEAQVGILHEIGCAAGILPRVLPTGDNPPVIIPQTACRIEVEAYAVKPVEAQGIVRVLANANARKLAPGPYPGASIHGLDHFTIISRLISGGV